MAVAPCSGQGQALDPRFRGGDDTYSAGLLYLEETAVTEGPGGTPLLDIRDLAVTFAGRGGAAPVEAVKGVSFTLDRGETLALVGESGSGKSVTALSILQLLPYPLAMHGAQSSVRFAGEELIGASPDALRQVRGDRIAMVFQEPMTSLNPLHTIERQIGEILLVHRRMSARAAGERILELLRMVQLPNAEGRLGAYPHQLSGGQRQRVMIAMAIANEPDILIADEPTTALDVTIQANILALLRDLRDRLGMALLLITHDLTIVRKMAERVCVMTEGEIVEAGPAAAIFDRPRHPYTKRLLAAEPKGRAAPADPSAPLLIEAEATRVWFPIRAGVLRRVRGYVKAVDGVSLEVRAGATLGVVGESGSGKTTLGLALLRLIASQGRIRFAGRDISRLSERRIRPLRREMQIVFQDPYSSLSPRLSVAQIVEEGLRVHNLAAHRRRAPPADRNGTRRGRARPAGGRPLSARVFRRPAPAHRDRPRLGAEAAPCRPRRADLGVGHVGAGADRRTAARIAEPPRPRLSVYQPRSARGPRARPRDSRDEGRPDRRSRLDRAHHDRTRTPLYPRADGRCLRSRPCLDSYGSPDIVG